MRKDLKKILEKCGETMQTIIAIEELGELQQCLTKELRGKSDIEHLTEEFADVRIVLEYIQYIYNLDKKEIENIINKKIKRTKKRMNIK